jgi:hypothetical protein
MHEDELRPEARSVVQGLARGLAVSLGMALATDAAAVGDATGWWRLGVPHGSVLEGLILTLALAAGLLELERLRVRKAEQA